MKDKILLFIVGVLIGAIISTGSFYIYTTIINKCNYSNQSTQVEGGSPPQMPGGQDSENGQPPEKPDKNNNEKPSEKPDHNNNEKSSEKTNDTQENN
ncbi:MAG: hypothetical protein IKH54_00215 [Bacilli bacterium]|nr:hypothetical protein [Bacilli bacterium]